MGTLILLAGWLVVTFFGIFLAVQDSTSNFFDFGALRTIFEGGAVNASFSVAWVIVGVIIGIIGAAAVIGVGYLPIWVALARKHHEKTPIVLINFFADWTIIGWFGALSWSLTKVDND